MTFQKTTAGMVAVGVLGIATMIAPVETSARSGGFVAVPSLSAHGAVRSSFASPHSALTHVRDFRMARPGDRHGAVGSPLWWAGSYLPGYPYPSGYVEPSGEVPYASPMMENFSERSRPIATHEPSCRTDAKTVPSESGGERTINITRCY